MVMMNIRSMSVPMLIIRGEKSFNDKIMMMILMVLQSNRASIGKEAYQEG